MKTEEDEAFEEIERRQGGGFSAKRAMAADKQREREREQGKKRMTAALDRAVANALGLKSVNNCEKWSKTMTEEDDDIQVYKKPWVGLTDEERDMFIYIDEKDKRRFRKYGEYIEQLLKEKNG